METERVKTLDYFVGMTASEVEVVAGAMREDAWWDEAVVVQQGDNKGSVYFVLEGIIRIEQRKETGEIVSVGRLGPGAVFGVLGVLDGVQRAASCVAEGTVRCAIMERKDFIDLMNGATPLAMRFQLAVLRCIARDIRSTNAKLTELAALPSCKVTVEDLEEVF